MSTLAQLRSRFYRRFDEQGQQYISADEANDLVNEGAAQLHNWLVTEGENYVWQELSITFVAGQADYPLPPDLLKVLKVYVAAIGPTPSLMPLPRIMPQEYRGPARQGQLSLNSAYCQPTGYMMMGQMLRIVPTPVSAIGKLVVWYAPQYKALTLDTDITPLSMFVGAEEFIINQAVIGARLKEESDTSGLERRQQLLLGMIQQTLINRDMGQHSHVVDAGITWQ